MAEQTKERWVYAGKRINAKQTGLHYIFYVESTNERTGYAKLKLAGARAGDVYLVTVERDDEKCMLFTGGDNMPRYVGRDSEYTAGQISTWAAEHEAAIVWDDLRKLRKKVGKDDEFNAALAVIRATYDTVPYVRKRALLAYILEVVTR